MEPKYPIIVSAGAIQEAAYAALRVLAVLIGGMTAIFGFLSKHDLAGLIAYVQSSDFTVVAGAVSAVVSFGYGVWSTYWRKKQLVATAKGAPDAVATVVSKPVTVPCALAAIPVLMLVGAGSLFLTGCATTGTTVRLNTDKAFLTAQIAFHAVQQTTAAACSAPPAAMVKPCNSGIDLLHTGALAENAAFTAQQAGNAADLQAAVTTLANLPAQLVALGILKAN